MKKLFISCPMRGRTAENIENSMKRMHKIAELIFNQELEPIQSYIPNEVPPVTHDRVWMLGESIKMMADADYFIGIGYSEVFKGCEIEMDVAKSYGIPNTYVAVEEFMPDAAELEKEYYNKLMQG